MPRAPSPQMVYPSLGREPREPLQSIDTQVLLRIPPHIHLERVPRDLLLPRRRAHQPGHEIDLALRLRKGRFREQGALVDEADKLAQRADVVWQTAFARGPDDEEGDGVDGDEEDEGVVAWHAGQHSDVLGFDDELGREHASRQDGQGQGKEADEGDVGYFVVTIDERFDGDFDR